MYEGIEKKKLEQMANIGQEVFDLMIDNAHNSCQTSEDLLEINDDQWKAIGIWEKHLRRNFASLIEDIKFDLDHETIEEKQPTCWLCGGSDPNTTITVECETPGGDSCPPKSVPVHHGCYMDIAP